ncbi:MAG: two pore domain potassium channel family protein [Candidatus Omnitrophica bacterium]|nr:two pore domain potassium channel family protein [Candidatus Omnitrophota bacterium]
MVTFGTVGMHLIEGMSYLDAFYFISMLATAQGPAVTPATPAGKLFAALLAFVSIGCVVASLGFLFGPFFGQLWRVGIERLEEDAQTLTRRDKTRKK